MVEGIVVGRIEATRRSGDDSQVRSISATTQSWRVVGGT